MLLPGEGGGLLIGDMRQKRISQLDARLDCVRSAQVPGMPLCLLPVEGDRVIAVWMRFGSEIEPLVGAVDLSSGQVDEGFSLFDPGVGLSRPAP